MGCGTSVQQSNIPTNPTFNKQALSTQIQPERTTERISLPASINDTSIKSEETTSQTHSTQSRWQSDKSLNSEASTVTTSRARASSEPPQIVQESKSDNEISTSFFFSSFK